MSVWLAGEAVAWRECVRLVGEARAVVAVGDVLELGAGDGDGGRARAGREGCVDDQQQTATSL